MPHDYQIIDRGEEVPPGKRWTFKIDGHESLYYSSLRRGIERVVERIQKGSLQPGGIPIAKFGAGGKAEPHSPRERKQATEDAAVLAFLTRGTLKDRELATDQHG